MNLDTLAGHIDPEKVFAIARSQPRFKAGLDPDKLKGYILDIATQQAANALSASALDHVNALYAEHVAVWGERPEDGDPTQEDWETELDASANLKFEPFTPQTGHGWQGEYLDDCQLWDEAKRVALAHSFGSAYVEGVLGTTDAITGKSRTKKPGKRLSSLGILQPEIDAFAETLGKPKTEEARVQDMASATEIVHSIVRAYAEDRGDALDMTEFMLLIEQAADSEDILAMSAISSMDARAEPVAATAAFRTLKEGSGTYADDLTLMLFTEEPPAPPAPTPAAVAKAEKKQRAPKEKPTTIADTVAIPSEVLVRMAALGGTDREMAELFNVQRPAYNKCKNGDTDLLCHVDRVADAMAWAERQSAVAQEVLNDLILLEHK